MSATPSTSSSFSSPHATLYRMVTDDHVCPFGIKARDLLEREGFELEDHYLETREETDAFKQRYDVETTPQVFIEGKRIGEYDALREHLGKESAKDEDETTYAPIAAIFGVTELGALIGDSGEVWCWGSRDGLSDFEDPRAHEPVKLEGFAGATDIALGSSLYVCAQTAPDQIVCGQGEASPTPVDFGQPGEIVEFSAHDQAVCARFDSGQVACQGTITFGAFIPDAETLADIEDATALSSDRDHVCIARQAGSITCVWRDMTRRGESTTQIDVEGVERLSSRGEQVCAHLQSGQGVCWDVKSGEEVSRREIDAQARWSVSRTHTCTLAPSGEATCQGGNLFGQLGRAEADLQIFARDLMQKPLELIAAGDTYTCLRDTDGKMRCEGDLPEGLDALQGEEVSGLHAAQSSPWVAISQGALFGEDGELAAAQDDPFIEVRSSSRGACGLRASGKLWCEDIFDQPASGVHTRHFGDYVLSEGGELEQTWSRSSVRLQRTLPGDPSTLRDLEVTLRNACAWFASGEVWCAGQNDHGELGRATSGAPDTYHEFEQVNLPEPIVHASFASYGGQIYISHGCAVGESGKVYCWGKNHFGQLGDGTTVDRNEPVEVQGIEDVVKVTAGTDHTCAERQGGVISCWGDSTSGQTGELYRVEPQDAAPVRFADQWSFD